MPSRRIPDELNDDARFEAVSFAGELFYRRLMLVVDDYGRFDARTKLLRSRVYGTMLERVKESDVKSWLEECQQAGLIRVYRHGNSEFLELVNTPFSVRAKFSKYPAPPWAQTCADAHTSAQTCADAHTSAQTCADGESVKINDTCAQMRTDVHTCAQMCPISNTNTNTNTISNTNKALSLSCAQEVGGQNLPGDGVSGGGSEVSGASGGSVDHGPRCPGSGFVGAEAPSLAEVQGYAVQIGLAPWKAEDWWRQMEGVGWRHRGQPVVAWRPMLLRVKALWEADGRPMGPVSFAKPALVPGGPKNAPPKNGAAGEVWRLKEQLAALERVMTEHPAHPESNVGRPATEAERAQYRDLKKRAAELRARLAGVEGKE